MRVPLSWLKEWVDVPWDAEQLAERLTGVGLEVEAIERPGAEVSGVVLAQIREVNPHPQADRLWVCTVDTGQGTATVVTGAPNVEKAGAGTWVVYAAPGATLPGGVTIQTREFRGVRSEGMLCSTWELGLPTDAKTDDDRLAEGLLILPAEEQFTPGMDAVSLLGLGEPVLVLDLTPNYAAHCQSILGIAREVAALTGSSVHVPPVPAVAESGEDAADYTAVTIACPEGCSTYVARIIDDVKIGSSPLWLRRRLQLAGMRPINNVVDVTNYVMLETGQPLHGFDYDLLAEGRIIVRLAARGEHIRTLDGLERELSPNDLVIADAHRPVALAGIMGGAATQVRPETRRILLEAAHFNPKMILRTSRRLGLRTEASMRFEKGFDPEAPEAASLRAATLIASLAGGRLLEGAVTASAGSPERKVFPLRPKYINGLLGTDLSPAQIEELLGRYGFTVQGEQIYVPSYRTDIHGEADLAEEVARLYGYDRIPAQPPSVVAGGGGRPERERLLLDIKRQVVSCGFTEISTYSFAPPGLPQRLNLPEDHPQWQAVKIANPMTEEQACLRATLLGGILENIRHHARHRIENLAVFELGTVYLPSQPPGENGQASLPAEHQSLMLAACGDLRVRHWQGLSEQADVFMLKGVLERLAAYCRRPLEVVTASGLSFLHPGRAAWLCSHGQRLGYLGELHPDLCQRLELPDRTVVAELDLSRWLHLETSAWQIRPVPRFPAVDRDVAFELPDSVPSQAAEQLIRRTAGEWLEQVTLFDVYRGRQVTAGHRSLAYTLRYRAGDRTLTDEEVDAVHNRVRQALADELGAKLR